MGVDEQRMTIGIRILGKAGEVDLPGRREGQRLDERVGIAPVVHARHMDIVDVEQQPAARAPDKLRDEFAFAQGRFDKLDISGGILNEHAPPQAFLDAVNMLADTIKGARIVRGGQQVIEEGPAMARTGEVLGKGLGRVTLQKRRQPIQIRRFNQMMPVRTQVIVQIVGCYEQHIQWLWRGWISFGCLRRCLSPVGKQ